MGNVCNTSANGVGMQKNKKACWVDQSGEHEVCVFPSQVITYPKFTILLFYCIDGGYQTAGQDMKDGGKSNLIYGSDDDGTLVKVMSIIGNVFM